MDLFIYLFIFEKTSIVVVNNQFELILANPLRKREFCILVVGATIHLHRSLQAGYRLQVSQLTIPCEVCIVGNGFFLDSLLTLL